MGTFHAHARIWDDGEIDQFKEIKSDSISSIGIFWPKGVYVRTKELNNDNDFHSKQNSQDFNILMLL